MKLLLAVALLAVALAPAGPQNSQAPTGFDDKSNGLVDDTTHQTDQDKFDATEGVGDGLGPLHNAQSCRECHQNLTSGGTSQMTELRVGHSQDLRTGAVRSYRRGSATKRRWEVRLEGPACQLAIVFRRC